MYKIEIDYQTGNTFGSHDETRLIDCVVFEDLESAKQALRIISKHQEMVRSYSGWGKSKDEIAIAKQNIAQQPWAVKSDYSDDYDYAIKVPTSIDCQEWEEIYCFWMGYFEVLQEARIVDAGRDELSISFR